MIPLKTLIFGPASYRGGRGRQRPVRALLSTQGSLSDGGRWCKGSDMAVAGIVLIVAVCVLFAACSLPL